MDSETPTPAYTWKGAEGDCVLSLVPVAGCIGMPYSFGEGRPAGARPVEVPDFCIAAVPVTQALWVHVMGDNPSARPGMNLPLENVSWDAVAGQGGFLERINQSAAHTAISRQTGCAGGRFRLPTETEWEYAARGGRR